jgi:hypothetical protein
MFDMMLPVILPHARKDQPSTLYFSRGSRPERQSEATRDC